MKTRAWVFWLALGFAATSAPAAPIAERFPSYTEFNLARPAATASPVPASPSLQASLSPQLGVPSIQARVSPTVEALVVPSGVLGPQVRSMPMTGAPLNSQAHLHGEVPASLTPGVAPRQRPLSRSELKSFLIDEMDAKLLIPSITTGRRLFDGNQTVAELSDPAAAARRHRVPASEAPAAAKHRMPQQDPPKPFALVQMNRSPASEMIINAHATRLISGAQKWHDNVVKFAPGWQKASFAEAIERHMGTDYRIVISKTGKLIYENKSTGVQIVIDAGNGYFRIFKPSAPGSVDGQYLNLNGEVPTAEIVTKNGIRRVPLTGGEMNKATHFILVSNPPMSAPPSPS